jgi:hypothetical protein
MRSAAVTFHCKQCSGVVRQSLVIQLRAWSVRHGASNLRFCSWRCFMAWVSGQPG